MASMALLTVSIAVHHPGEVAGALERAERAAHAGARMVEWRIDGLAEHARAVSAALDLVKRSPLPCIVTCRPVDEGGTWGGDEQERISLFEALGASDFPPRYIDLELRAYQRSANLRQKALLAVDHSRQVRDLKTSLILSSHDFSGRPADLLRVVEQMTAEEACAVVKVAWTARSLRDNLEAFDLLRARGKPMIALCMGRFGLMSRVLAGKFGGMLTYASDGEGDETAPGQPTIEALRSSYRFERINAATKVYGVIGWPIDHSLSPQLHNAGFDAINHDGVYLPLPVPPEWEHFKATLGSLIDHEGLDFRGASISIPHKSHLVRFVRERGGSVDSLAERIGAANTLCVDEAGSVSCANTDCAAAVDALCAGMGIEPSDLSSRRIAVLGAGGTARAVIVGLIDRGATVVVFNRDQARAEAIEREFNGTPTAHGGVARLVAGKPDALGCGCFHAFINCTPIGMTGGPAPQDSPLPESVALDDSTAVMDMVYAPERTPLIREAESRGARVITGLDVFIRQATAQFELWTGASLPASALRSLPGQSASSANSLE
jgi:3-dehydroquinate dehydratase/shikimate dehydrogenase